MTNPEIHQPQDMRTELASDITLEELLQKLVHAGIPVEQYGTGVAKTVPHLLAEIHEGESLMSVNDKGEIFRDVNVVWADVICTVADGTTYVLKEDRQEFKDGRVKRRNLNSSLGEKLKPGEIPDEAVNRAIEEELGITEPLEGVYYLGYQESVVTPDTYPGLESSYQFHKYATIIPETSFKPEGYVEYQQDKTNYYVWEVAHIEKDSDES